MAAKVTWLVPARYRWCPERACRAGRGNSYLNRHRLDATGGAVHLRPLFGAVRLPPPDRCLGGWFTTHRLGPQRTRRGDPVVRRVGSTRARAFEAIVPS